MNKIIKKIFKIKNSTKNIAVVRLSGIIGKKGFGSGINSNNLKYLNKIKKIKNLKAIVLIINSPGGSPVQSEFISKRIKMIAQECKGKVPIITFCEDLAASGGYWLACIGSEIYASSASIIGSIGVISQGFGFSDAIKKMGIERRVITQGENKSVLDPFVDVKKSDIELIKNIQYDVHQSFISFVKESRGSKLKAQDKDIFNGRFWSGKQALELGLIDGIGYYEEILKKKYGNKVVIKEINETKSFIQKKMGSTLTLLSDEIENKVENFVISKRYKI